LKKYATVSDDDGSFINLSFLHRLNVSAVFAARDNMVLDQGF